MNGNKSDNQNAIKVLKENVQFPQVVARIPLDRILLETDAPYFKAGIPQMEGQNMGTIPGDVIYSAAGVAKIKNLPIEAIICQTRLNVKSIYGI